MTKTTQQRKKKKQEDAQLKAKSESTGNLTT